ncbi:MAG: addiction module toxin RelE [Clostridia bacterium BRH_c25]|nr:MAG: addiction module toxin RelE [Clostridia bacterium BRH_c25]
MTREFIITHEFDKRWAQLGLNDDDLFELENFLCEHPEAGPVVQGTGGLRKLRWYSKNRGKSGGLRVVYVDFAFYEKIYLISAYPKSIKDDLSNEECNEIKKLIKSLEQEAKGSDKT